MLLDLTACENSCPHWPSSEQHSGKFDVLKWFYSPAYYHSASKLFSHFPPASGIAPTTSHETYHIAALHPMARGGTYSQLDRDPLHLTKSMFTDRSRRQELDLLIRWTKGRLGWEDTRSFRMTLFWRRMRGVKVWSKLSESLSKPSAEQRIIQHELMPLIRARLSHTDLMCCNVTQQSGAVAEVPWVFCLMIIMGFIILFVSFTLA